MEDAGNTDRVQRHAILNNMIRKKIKVIDLFSGVGGLSYGFAHDDNFEIIAANEILPNMAKAYSLNHPSVKMYAEDIKDFSAERLERSRRSR